jgi:hypothetical protein
MSHVTDELAARLECLAPEFSDANWADVVRRANTTPARRKRRMFAPRVLIASAAVLLMGGSLALAVGGRVLTVFDPPSVPASVEREFQQLVKPLRPGLAHDTIIRGSERRVLTVRTLGGASAHLWTARTGKGLLCFVAVGAPYRESGCMLVAGQNRDLVQWYSSRHDPQHVARGLTFAGKAANSRVRVARVDYASGGHLDVGVVNGWFMVEVPPAHTVRRTAPVRIELLEAGGTVASTVPDPLRLRHVRRTGRATA